MTDPIAAAKAFSADSIARRHAALRRHMEAAVEALDLLATRESIVDEQVDGE